MNDNESVKTNNFVDVMIGEQKVSVELIDGSNNIGVRVYSQGLADAVSEIYKEQGFEGIKALYANSKSLAGIRQSYEDCTLQINAGKSSGDIFKNDLGVLKAAVLSEHKKRAEPSLAQRIVGEGPNRSALRSGLEARGR